MYRKIKSIEFHKDILIITTHNEKPYVAIKPICEAAGLTWGSQYNRIMRDEVLSEGVFITKTPSEGGAQDTLFLPVMMLQGWMFGVSIKRVKPELRPKLLQYKRECYQVLHDHFNNGEAINPRKAVMPTHRRPPKYRYIVSMTVEDFVTGQTETFRGGANTPDEIITGTANRFGMHIFDMVPVPINAF